MKTKLHRLVRASIIILATILICLMFRSLHPIISLLIVFTLMQLVEEVISHIKEIKKINKTYGNVLATSLIQTHIKKMIVDVITLLIWFCLVVGVFFLIKPWM